MNNKKRVLEYLGRKSFGLVSAEISDDGLMTDVNIVQIFFMRITLPILPVPPTSLSTPCSASFFNLANVMSLSSLFA